MKIHLHLYPFLSQFFIKTNFICKSGSNIRLIHNICKSWNVFTFFPYFYWCLVILSHRQRKYHYLVFHLKVPYLQFSSLHRVSDHIVMYCVALIKTNILSSVSFIFTEYATGNEDLALPLQSNTTFRLHFQ